MERLLSTDLVKRTYPNKFVWPPKFFVKPDSAKEINAYASAHPLCGATIDDKSGKVRPVVMATQGIIHDLIKDDENSLAVIMGHELAHLSCDHVSGRKGETDVLILAFNRDQEIEADLEGLRLAIAAGYPYRIGVAKVIQAMRKRGGRSSFEGLSSTHPSWEDRLVFLMNLSTHLGRYDDAAAQGLRCLEIGSVKMTVPHGIPGEYGEHIRLSDLLVLAFQGALTRISSFVYANDGSNRSYRQIEVSEGHHDLSHHGRNKDKQAKLHTINMFHITQLAYLLNKLKGIRDGDGSTLLDNCMIVYGSGIGDGDQHNHDNLPILLAGKGGGALATGRHIRCPRNTPLMNLYVNMLDRVGVKVESFGDSTGRLSGLDV